MQVLKSIQEMTRIGQTTKYLFQENESNRYANSEGWMKNNHEINYQIKQDKMEENQKKNIYKIYMRGPLYFAKIKGSCWGTNKVEDIYFMTGLSRWGAPISLTSSRGGDVTTQEFIVRHCFPSTKM